MSERQLNQQSFPREEYHAGMHSGDLDQDDMDESQQQSQQELQRLKQQQQHLTNIFEHELGKQDPNDDMQAKQQSNLASQ